MPNIGRSKPIRADVVDFSVFQLPLLFSQQPLLFSACVLEHKQLILLMPLVSAKSPRKRKDARPQELLVAALELFGEKGFAATRTEEIAKRAGVSKGTLYIYFPSKKHLLKAVIQESLSTLIEKGREIENTYVGSTGDLLKCLILNWWREVGDTSISVIHKIMISEVRNFPEIGEFYAHQVAIPGQQLFMQILQRGIDRGEFKQFATKEISVAIVAQMMYLCLHKHSLGACADQDSWVEPAQVLVTYVDVLLFGIRR